MKSTIISITLLLLAAASQAQERRECLTQAGKRLFPQKNERRAATRASIGKPAVFKGEKRGLIILMEFPNQKFVNKTSNGKAIDVRAQWNDIANKENLRNVSGVLVCGSVRDYFRDQSYGQFTIDFDVVGPYTAKNKYGYYGRNFEYQGNTYHDEHANELITEACQAANKDVKFKDYDWDGDGEVEEVYVVYAGHGEADYYDKDTETIWPHKSYLSGWTGSGLALQDVIIDTYACSNELNSSDRYDGIGGICHEFGHCLGLPDVYNTDSGEAVVGNYDIMDSGSYNGGSWYPPSYSSFERYFCGWIEPKEISDVSQVDSASLRPLHQAPDAYIIHPFPGSTDYYMIENRAKESWDKFLPSFGLMAWYIDYVPELWEKNQPNNDAEHLGISRIELSAIPSTSAIAAPSLASDVPEGWYDLRGRRLPAAPDAHGVYIVRLADGTIKKYTR